MPKLTVKSSACCGSGKFIAWIGFILATFAMAGVVVVMADKSAGSPAVAPSVFLKKVSPIGETPTPPVITSTDVAVTTAGNSVSKVDMDRSSLSALEFQIGLLQDYVAQLAGGQAVNWPKHEMSFAMDGVYYAVDFIYPPLPMAAKRSVADYDEGIWLGYDQTKIALNSIDVSIKMATSTLEYADCDVKAKHSGIDYIACLSVNGGMESTSDNPVYINVRDIGNGKMIITKFDFNGPSVQRYCDQKGSGVCAENRRLSEGFAQIVEKMLDNTKITATRLPVN